MYDPRQFQQYAPPADPQTNPYRAPTSAGLADTKPPWGWLKWVYLATGSFTILGLVGGIAAIVASIIMEPEAKSPPPLATAGMILAFSASMLVYAALAAGLVWLYGAWACVPPEQRFSRHWKGPISTAMFIGFMFIPYFNLYWMFVANCALCDALDRMRVAYPTREAAPKNLAIAACIFHLLVFFVAPVLWFLFMKRVDAMLAEMQASSQAARQRSFSPVAA